MQVWAAQRVPDGEIAAIANQFVIRGIDVKDTKNFMASKNIFEVAERSECILFYCCYATL